MQGFPHIYETNGRSEPETAVTLSSAGLPELSTTPPPEFGGPAGNWSPETLLTASVVDCFILTFKAIAKGSKLEWTKLDVDVKGTLDRVDNVTRFTRFDLQARLEVPAGTDTDRADKILHKSEAMCLITRSLATENHLETLITVA